MTVNYALIEKDSVVNTVVAEPGWAHPDLETVPMEQLTEEHAESRGVKFARSAKDIQAAYEVRDTIILGGVGPSEIYQLLKYDLPEGCFIAGSTGTTGGRKLSCTPWAKIERRAQAFLEMMGNDLISPVWFPDKFSVTAFSSTGRMCCIINSIPAFYGPELPQEKIGTIAGLPRTVKKRLHEVPEDVVILVTGGSIPDHFLKEMKSRRFIDFYSSTDGGSISMTKYEGDNSEVILPNSGKMVTAPNGSIELPLDQVTDRYLTHEIPIKDGRFVTGDKIVDGKIRRIR